MLGFVGMMMGVIQAEWLPQIMGYGHPLLWIVALLAGGFMCGGEKRSGASP